MEALTFGCSAGIILTGKNKNNWEAMLMKVTTKGQVTIPLPLREKTGIVPGCTVEFREERGRLYLKKVAGPGRGDVLVRRMAGKGELKMSTDEIMALTRGDG